MNKVNRPGDGLASLRPEMPFYSRHPQRISITLNWAVHQQLIERSDIEGRSLSNLAAHLLEVSCKG